MYQGSCVARCPARVLAALLLFVGCAEDASPDSSEPGTDAGADSGADARIEPDGEAGTSSKPIYVLWLNHFKDQVNVEDDVRILNDLLDLFASHDLDVEWTMNGALLQALRDGVRWPTGRGHTNEEWLVEPEPALLEKLAGAGDAGAVFSTFGDIFMPDWSEGAIRSGELTSFEDALALEIDRQQYFRDPATGVMARNRTGGQSQIFEDLLGGDGAVYTFATTLEPHVVHASRLAGGRFGSEHDVLDEISADVEGPAYWYMGVLHFDLYAPDLLRSVLHWDPVYSNGDRHGTAQIDDDVDYMQSYLDGADAEYAIMYAGAHTHSLFNQGCMNAGPWDYDDPPPEPCIRSPYIGCNLTSYSVGGNASVSDPGFDPSCLAYLNAADHAPRDWFEMMYNPATHPSEEVVAEGRRDDIYARNLDYLARFVDRLARKVAATPRMSFVTRQTALDLFQVEEGRPVSVDTIHDIARSLIDDWESSGSEVRPPRFVQVPASDDRNDRDYFTLAESYRLLQLALAAYHETGGLPAVVTNAFAMGITNRTVRSDDPSRIDGPVTVRDVAAAAADVATTNEYGDYQVQDGVVGGNRLNPAELLLLMAKAFDALYGGAPPAAPIDLVGSRVLTSIELSPAKCFSAWCPYQLWTFKPARHIGAR